MNVNRERDEREDADSVRIAASSQKEIPRKVGLERHRTPVAYKMPREKLEVFIPKHDYSKEYFMRTAEVKASARGSGMNEPRVRLEAPYFAEFAHLSGMEREAMAKDLKYVEYKLPDESFYQGYVETIQRHGPGILTCLNGSRYEGEWKNEMRHGRG